MTDYSTHWKALIHDLRNMESVPMSNYCSRLYNKARGNSRSQPFWKYLQRRDKFPKDDAHADDQTLDGKNIFTVLGRLADSSIANAISGVDDQHDTVGVKNWIDSTKPEQTDLELATRLFSFCLAEHISYNAHKSLHRTLRELGEMPGFAKYAQKKAKDPFFIRDQILHDVTKGNNFFSVCVLFVCDYLEERIQEPSIWGAERLPMYGKKYTESPSFGVVQEWGRYLWEVQGKASPDMMDKIVEYCGKASSAVFCPTTTTGILAPQPAFEIVKSLHEQIIAYSADKDHIKHIESSLSRLEHEKETINAWKAYCSTLHHTWQIDIGLEWKNAVSSALAQHDSGFKIWVTEGHAWELNNVDQQERIFTKPPSLAMAQGSTMGIVTGTKISLADGTSIAVEQLSVNDEVRTHEEGMSKVGYEFEMSALNPGVSLVAFNGESHFATDSQVFYTSTGLRAVNPEAARRMNPLANIGRLRVGHVLYRLRGDTKNTATKVYEYQEVKSIDIVDANAQRVCSLSTVGLCSYHANGYLLHTNDPEVGFGEFLGTLKQMPTSQLMIYLSSLPELAPVFQKLDNRTIHEYVLKELYGTTASVPPEKYNSVSDQVFSSPEEQQKAIYTSAWSQSSGIPIEHLDLNLSLISNRDGYHDYKMPCIRILDGILVVGEQVQHHAVVDWGRRTFRWSRQLSKFGEYRFEHGSLHIFPDATGGYGVIQLSLSPSPDDINQEFLYPFEAVHAAVLSNVVEYRSSNTEEYMADPDLDIKPIFSAQLKYDKKNWLENEKRPSSSEFIKGDLVQIALYKSPEGGTESTITVPVLDTLRAELNNKFGSKLDSLYMGAITTTKTGYRANIEVQAAAVFPFLSDIGPDMLNIFNIDFKTALGKEFKLPLLWQSMEIDFDMDEGKATGAVYQYDPKMRGLRGHRHLLEGDMDVGSAGSASTRRMRSIISKSFTVVYPSPGISSTRNSGSGQPASITDELSYYADLKIDALKKIDYKSQEIHNAAQSILMQTVQYHMTEKQRNLLKLTKPSKLASDLAEGLGQDVRDFISKEYAPAFIGYMTSTVRGYEKELDQSEQDKIWYWFQGQGDKCMAKRKEYTTLNNLAGVEAVKQIHEKDLAPFMTTTTQAKKWAKLLYDDMMRPWMIKTYAFKCADNGGYIQINKICMLLNVLDDNIDFAEQWFERVIPEVRHQTLTYPYIDKDEKINKQFLDDAMRSLILAVFRGDKELTDDVRNALLKQLEEFEKANNIEVEKDLEKRASNIVVKMSVLNAELARWVSSIVKAVKLADLGLKMFAAIAKGFEWGAKKITGIVGVKGMKGVATISMAALYVFQVGASVLGLYQNWDHMSPEDRASCILENLRTICQGVNNVIETWKRYTTTGEPTTPQDFVDTIELDQQTGKNLESQGKGLKQLGNKLYPKKGLRGAIAENMAKDPPTLKLQKKPKWNEDRLADPADVPGGGLKGAKKFSLQGNYLRVASAIIGIGVAIAMTISLIREWGDLTTVGKILETGMVIVQFLTVAIEIVELGATVGLYAITGAFAVALPIFGAVLAVVGVVLMILSFFLNKTQQKTPPDPVKEYIHEDVKPVIKDWSGAPPPQLSYNIQPDSMTGGTPNSLNIKVTNTSANDVKIQSSTIIITSGEDETCLLQEKKFVLADIADPKKDTAGYTYLDSPNIATGTLNSNRMGNAAEFFKFTLDIFGPGQEGNVAGELNVKAGQSFTAKWTGTAAKAGKSVVEIVEKWKSDSSHKQAWITKT